MSKLREALENASDYDFNTHGNRPVEARKENFKVVHALLEQDQDFSDDDPPLVIAVDFANFKAVQLLLDYGANIELTNPKGKTFIRLYYATSPPIAGIFQRVPH